jgi:hypothetical protein
LPLVIAFLSTGRCGTQWLSAAFRELYPALWVEHEPIGPRYAPRQYFRRYTDPEAILEVPEVAEHLSAVAASSRMYVETGWPLFAALPLMCRLFGRRLRIVHLTRHPVPSALSHMAHKSYAGSPRDDAYTRLATLGPEDRGVIAGDYGERWAELSSFEKCLFWWTQVHGFGLELESWAAGLPFLRLSSEALLSGAREPLERLVGFLDLPFDERWLERVKVPVDCWRHRSDEEVDPLWVERHPVTVEVARRLGYDASDVDVASLARRYAGEPDPGLDRFDRGY